MGVGSTNSSNIEANKLLQSLPAIGNYNFAGRASFGSLPVNGINLGNVLAGIENIEAMGSDDSQTQANAVQGFISNIMSVLSSFTTGEATAAGTEVGKNQKDAAKLVSATEEQKIELQSSFSNIQQGIESQNNIIDEATGVIDELQTKQKEQEDKIKEAAKEIENLKSKLANSTDPDMQTDLLNEITAQLGIISTSISVVNEIKTELETQSTNVENAYNTIADWSKEAESTQEEGVKNLETLATNVQQNIQNNNQTQTKSTVNKTTSIEAASSAEAASSNVFTGSSIAPKLFRVSADQGSAASIRTIGSATIWSQMTQGINNLSNGADLISSYCDTIGSALSNCENLVGAWNFSVSPIITSIGSVESFSADVNEFSLIVKEDKASIKTASNTNYVQRPQEEQNDNKNKSNPYIRANLQNSETWNDKNEYKNELKTPRTQLKFGL